MIAGIGLDIVEVPRFDAALRRHAGRLEVRVFTAAELADCADRADRTLALAARFAAKEACIKALGGVPGVRLRDIEVLRAPSGAPSLRLHGRIAEQAVRARIARTHLSLTHQASVAAAMVVLEGAEDAQPSP